MTSRCQPVLVQAEAASLRRKLGPNAWCALEVLIASAHPSAGGLIATASVRTVAAELGVAKGTAQRALELLARAGLVAALQDRDGLGRYTPGHYAITARASQAVCLAPEPPETLAVAPPAVVPPGRPATERRTRPAVAQLVLLDTA